MEKKKKDRRKFYCIGLSYFLASVSRYSSPSGCERRPGRQRTSAAFAFFVVACYYCSIVAQIPRTASDRCTFLVLFSDTRVHHRIAAHSRAILVHFQPLDRVQAPRPLLLLFSLVVVRLAVAAAAIVIVAWAFGFFSFFFSASP